MRSLKLNIKRFGISIDENEPIYSYSENAEMKINADLKIEGTNRKLKNEGVYHKDKRLRALQFL